MKINFKPYHDTIQELYHDENDPSIAVCRNVTFQVTDDCCFKCSYCYQGHKGHKQMSKETAKAGIDLLFEMYEKNDNDFINQNTKSIILEFIGGEPLMNIDLIDYICTYFMEKCLKENHPWLYTWRGSITSNGVLIFNPKVKEFFNKFKDFVSFCITIDGPKDIHDACRIYPTGEGTFNDTYAAIKEFNETIYKITNTKVTIAPDNLKNLNKIIDFFVAEGYDTIHANPVYEEMWTVDQARIYYNELKIIADKILNNKYENIYISLFDEYIGDPLPETENQNWCGGTMNMLAFDPEGIAYPCIRYMPSSLGEEIKPIQVGNVNGLFQNEESKITYEYLSSITRRSQSTDECFYCPVASGCAWCSAWNYQKHGDVNIRDTSICWMHRARVLANVYYWNQYYKKNNIEKKFNLNLSVNIATQIISEEEFELLKKLAI